MNAAHSFHPAALLERFATLPVVTGYCVALSGGADSVALLIAMVEIREQIGKPLRAIHVHHGLQAGADEWTAFCRTLCAAHDVPLVIHRVKVERARGESLEAAARRHRYAAFADSLCSDEVLLTAHHCDDQVETMLLHLLKGAGTDGLAAMPVARPFARGMLLRPLLQTRRGQLLNFLESRRVEWVNDPSNRDLCFDRNYLRHMVIPGLTSRWPSAVFCLSRSAELQSTQRVLADELAKIDLAAAYDQATGTLKLSVLRALVKERRWNLLRFWLHHQQPIIRLSRQQLLSLDELVTTGKGNRGSLFRVAGNNIRWFQGRLFKDRRNEVPTFETMQWRLDEPLFIAALNLWLEPAVLIRTISDLSPADTVSVRQREGGEFIALPQRGRRSLKRLLQEWRVPGWMRSRLPLVWKDDRLICVPGYWIDPGNIP